MSVPTEVGERVRVVGGKHPDTPLSWIGREGVLVERVQIGTRAYRDVMLDGDKVPTRFYPVELLGLGQEPPDMPSRKDD